MREFIEINVLMYGASPNISRFGGPPVDFFVKITKCSKTCWTYLKFSTFSFFSFGSPFANFDRRCKSVGLLLFTRNLTAQISKGHGIITKMHLSARLANYSERFNWPCSNFPNNVGQISSGRKPSIDQTSKQFGGDDEAKTATGFSPPDMHQRRSGK